MGTSLYLSSCTGLSVNDVVVIFFFDEEERRGLL